MTPTSQQPINDDQELAKVLAGVSQEANDTTVVPVDSASSSTPAVTDDLAMPPLEDSADPVAEEPVTAPAPDPIQPVEPVSSYDDSNNLDSIKQDALQDLRPLVDKLNIAPEEKFDTFLLLLRSTDDKTLIPSAYEAARAIPDEARRAQALLDVIKEIDYLSGPK